MTLEQLRIFVAVAQHQHVTRAARELHLTQSATSAAIAALEARYAVKLFNRVGRRIELTETGRRLLTEARAVLGRAAEAQAVLGDLAGLKRGTLALAASQTAGNYWLPPVMHRYRKAHPGIELTLTIANTETVCRMVHEGAADLGFVEDAVGDRALSVTPLADDELVLVVHRTLWPGRRRTPSPADLKKLRWVFRERGSGTRAIFEATLKKRGIAPSDLDVVLELPSNEAVRAAVLDGAGATVLSRLAVAVPLKSGELIALDLALPPRHFLALRHKERHASPAEQAFQRIIDGMRPRKPHKASG